MAVLARYLHVFLHIVHPQATIPRTESGMNQLKAQGLSTHGFRAGYISRTRVDLSSLNVPALRQLSHVLEGRLWEYRAGSGYQRFLRTISDCGCDQLDEWCALTT